MAFDPVTGGRRRELPATSGAHRERVVTAIVVLKRVT